MIRLAVAVLVVLAAAAGKAAVDEAEIEIAQTGIAPTSSARIPRSACIGDRTSSIALTIAATLDPHQPGSDAPTRASQNPDHGQALGSGGDRVVESGDDHAQHHRHD